LFIGTVIGVLVHATLHCAGVPVFISVVQGLPSSQAAAHGCVVLLGSQVSGGVTWPSPQLLEQSVSLA
jgi:hypothetical protein